MTDFQEFVMCCRYGEEAEVEEILNVEPLFAFRENCRALFMAAGNGHVKVLSLLLRAATPELVNTANEEGNRPLHWAALNGHVEACKLLLSHGAVATLRNHAGLSPATLAEQREHLECSNVILQSYDPDQDDEAEDGVSADAADPADVVYSSRDPEYKEFTSR
ncbi:hypothetical protein HDU91_007208 [Kappamyces sp. JEL0680]|nr:hypothetical protein HDU91_007208 [Kappamyces sp. JEL0680]